MRSTYLLLLGAFAMHGAQAQDNPQAIQQWQSAHPSTLLISSERFNSLAGDEQELLGMEYIVYQDHIVLAQLEQYQSAKGIPASDRQPDAKDENALFIKRWLGNHPDVTLVSKAEFNAMDASKQQECQNNPSILLLKGETITMQDINQYGY
jgi:hypothetical protein